MVSASLCHSHYLQEVNEMWVGLGYYRRAKFWLEGAKQIVDGGKFPRTVASLKKVPGIGDYTAGAIASIAFNESVPLVDGNVVRVLARLRTISANPKDTVIVKKLCQRKEIWSGNVLEERNFQGWA